ncbi:MAG: FG-GAP-like repeat-containing protein [Gelidibacter sp.]
MNLKCNILITIAICFVFQPLFSQVFFENKAFQLGINVTGNSSSVLGGISFYDYDQDGWDDITLASKSNFPVRFFKNNSGTFIEQTFNMTITGHSKQVLWVDYDNDGDNDLFVTRVDAANKLYQNDGNFVFTDVTSAAGFPLLTVLKTYGAAFGDYDNDGYLDVFLSNKDDDLLIPNQLYHNNGDGTFTDVTVAAGISPVGHLSFCAVFFDYDKDGFQDIYISNDRFVNTNILYHNNGDGTFTDTSIASGTNIAANAMSTTIDDFNDDGWLDIYITNTSEGNYLLKNNGNGTFTDVALTSGTSFNSMGWGANFFDADNDADMDLYVSSMVENPNIGLLTTAFYECQTNYNYVIPSDAGFVNDTFASFSNAIGDVDNDGYTDFFVCNRAPANHSLWKNAGGTNNWLKINLEGTISNKNGIGSWIEVYANNKTMYRYTLCGEAFLGQNSATEIFGVNTATTIDYIKVKWLSGIEDILTDVAPNQTLTVVEGSTLSNSNFENTQIKIYPNPTNGQVYFSGFDSDFTVDIFDFMGRRMTSKIINQSTNSIDISSNTKGVYLLLIKTEEATITKKMVLY